MGREVKRVKADFEWPLNKVWSGYLNPYSKYSKDCPFCEGVGLNDATKRLDEDWYDHSSSTGVGWRHSITQDEVQALLDEHRLMDFTHEFIAGKGWQEKNPPYIPTAEEVNEWSRKGFGHDSCNRWVCVKARAKRLGVYGKCSYCKGVGYVWYNKKYEHLHDKWERKEPPKGKWYQVWETTSEGSPISPAFPTPEELARWLADNNASTFGSMTTTYDKWLHFINGPAWAPSMVVTNGTMMSGVNAAAAI